MENLQVISVTKTETIICRTSYCESCYQADRPNRRNHVCLVWGSGHNDYKVYRTGRVPPVRGYVPFLYKMDKVLGENVTGWRCCSVFNCGVEQSIENQIIYYRTIPDKWERFVYTLADWKALIFFKDFDYFI